MGLLDGMAFEQEHGKEIWEKENLYPRVSSHPKYLVRPNDMHIFEIDESNGCYRSYTNKNVVRQDGSRPNAQEHFTYENLTQNYYFFPIEDVEEIDLYEYFHAVFLDFQSWQSRPDGHGGRMGGTFTEFLRTTYRIAKKIEVT